MAGWRGRGAGLLAGTILIGSLLTGCSSGKGAGSSSGGFATPQDAVSKLLSDLTAHHYDAVSADIVPGEAAALRGPLEAMVAQLARLNVLKPGTTLSNLSGFSVSFADPTYDVSNLGGGVAFVHFTGGTVTTSVRPDQLPLGSTLTSALPRLPAPRTRTSPLGGPDHGLAAVEVRGRWYVSLGYSLAESIRRADRMGPPSPVQAVQPAGDSSPDAAVSDLFRSALTEDVGHLLALSAPDELTAARAYASLFVPKAQAATARFKGFEASIDRITFSDTSQSDGTLVIVKSIKVTGQVKGTPFTYQNGCLTVDGVAICRDNLGQLMASQHAPAPATRLVTLIAGMRPRLGIVVVKQNGKWFVSPTRTVVDAATAILSDTSPFQLSQVISDVRQLRANG